MSAGQADFFLCNAVNFWINPNARSAFVCRVQCQTHKHHLYCKRQPMVAWPQLGMAAPPLGLTAPLLGLTAPPLGLTAPPLGLTAPLLGPTAPLQGLQALMMIQSLTHLPAANQMHLSTFLLMDRLSLLASALQPALQVWVWAVSRMVMVPSPALQVWSLKHAMLLLAHMMLLPL